MNDPADRTEQPFYDRSTIGNRPRLAWPGGAHVAVAILVSIEYYEMQPPADAAFPANLPGGFGRGPYPDFRVFSQREYGNRVGVFRVMRALTERAIRATAAVDAHIAAQYRPLVDRLRGLDWEIAGHGQALTRVISNRMSEAEERAYIGDALQVLETAFGNRPAGWHGPEYGESERTPHLLAEQGIRYVLDWPNDEQPYTMRTAHGPLVSLPVAIDCDDVVAHWHRKLTMTQWRRSVADALDQLEADGATSGRLFVLNLHPWLIGHPFRIGFLEDLLDDIQRRQSIWLAPAGEIAAWFSGQSQAGG